MVAESVVDRLETIEVDDGDDERYAATTVAAQGGGDATLKKCPVEQTGRKCSGA